MMKESIVVTPQQEEELLREKSERIASAYDAVRDELFDTGNLFNPDACMKLEAVQHEVRCKNIMIPDDDDDLKVLIRMIIVKDLKRLDKYFRSY